jgi:tRNA threonylcarbamoyladenosine biosynthesis protein TsaB
MNLNLLALETSSSRCGVALLRESDEGCTVSVLEHEGAQEHAERLLPMAGQLLEQAGLTPSDLSAIAFGQGPGGFTGLRVACGVSQGMGLALGIPVLPIVSHLAVAQETGGQAGDIVLVALDARMNEVYLAAYQRGLEPGQPWITLHSPMLIAANEVVPWAMHHVDPVRAVNGALQLILAGDAWDVYAEQMGYPDTWLRSAVMRPQARAVAVLAREAWLRGEAILPELAAPLYVRDKVAFTTAEREGGLGGNPKALPAIPVPKLEPMLDSDVEAVAALEADLQLFPWTRGNFADALTSGYEACVLRLDGKVVGYCVVMLAPDIAQLLVVGVSRAHQRSGFGRQLMAWCEKVAMARDLPAVMLEVRPSNAAALVLYEKLGFQRMGLRRDYYPAVGGTREDGLVLQKTFSSQGSV